MCNRASWNWPSEPASVVAARQAVARQLTEWGVDTSDGAYGMVPDVLLAVSELVTNAVKYAPGPLTATVESHADRIRLDICDTNPTLATPITPATPTALTPGGRGLALIEALGRWGQDRHEDATKSVWCELPVTSSVALARNCTEEPRSPATSH